MHTLIVLLLHVLKITNIYIVIMEVLLRRTYIANLHFMKESSKLLGTVESCSISFHSIQYHAFERSTGHNHCNLVSYECFSVFNFFAVSSISVTLIPLLLNSFKLPPVSFSASTSPFRTRSDNFCPYLSVASVCW